MQAKYGGVWMVSEGVWQCQDGVWVCLAGVWGVWMSYKLKTVGQESLYKSVSFSPSDLLEPKRTKMAILDFSPCPGVFSGLGGWFLFQMASFGPLQSAGGVASSNFEFTHLSIHANVYVDDNENQSNRRSWFLKGALHGLGQLWVARGVSSLRSHVTQG